MDIRFVHPHFRLSDYDTNNRVKNTAIPSYKFQWKMRMIQQGLLFMEITKKEFPN
ncbi:unnamed protein product [Tenebrio molitor]|nr:unnamed protein product [Tenebrio molitor]